MATVDYFLKIDGIPGDSADDKHKGEIELESFSWGETQAGGARPGPGQAGKVNMQDFRFTMRVNSASPRLLMASARGDHLKLATVTARAAGKAQSEFLVLKFSDLVVSSYQTQATPNEPPIESLSFNFGRIDVAFRPQKADGSLDAPVTAGWDVKKNQPN